MTETRFNRRRLLLATTAVVTAAALPTAGSHAANVQGNNNQQHTRLGAEGKASKESGRPSRLPFRITTEIRSCGPLAPHSRSPNRVV